MDGILIVDKPQGLTSHDCVAFVRKKFSGEKVGHAGTLDPMATGVLVLLIGKYTKRAGSFLADDKEYEASLVLGARSDTGDACGRITPAGKEAEIPEDQIRRVFERFLGPIEQTPPMYSAVKYKGKKLYEFARKGLSVKVEPRKVVIKRLDILRIALPEVGFRVTCSKGTYIRQLSVDIGEALSCGAYMSSLRRTRSGAFAIGQAIGWDELKACDAGALSGKVISQ